MADHLFMQPEFGNLSISVRILRRHWTNFPVFYDHNSGKSTTTKKFVTPDVPERLIGDKAYDSDGLDQKLRENFGTEMIAPNRAKRRQTQDGRPLRRYVRRWKVERMFAWLFNFRRLVVRYEYHIENFKGFLQLAAAVILLRHL